MAKTFGGFSPKAIAFLRQLKKNNTRDWFQPRKDQFEELLRQPMLALTEMVIEQLRLFAVDHVLDPARAVHRIYRDVRFSKDKSPYKSSISAMFPRKGMGKTTSGGFYFSLSAEQVDIFAGVYLPMSPDLTAIRRRIADDPQEARKILEDSRLIKIAGQLQGEQANRPPKNFTADHPAIDLIRRKQFYYSASLPAKAATLPGLEKILLKHFKATAPAVDYFNNILLRANADPSEAESRPKRPKPMF